MQNRYNFVLALIQEAGQKVLESRDKHIDVSSKGGDERDLVTNVDREVGEFITERIKAAYPDEAVRSEEAESETKDSFWSIDPIDGTSNFARNIPHYAVVISYIENRVPVVGAIYNPITKDLFSFEKGNGAFENNRPIKVSGVTTLKDAYVLLHIGRKEDVRDWGIKLQKHFLAHAKKNTNLGSSALDLAFLASGREDVVIYGTMSTMDIAVAAELLRAAGGEIYSPDGVPMQYKKEPQQIIATASRELFDEISKI